jgi:hypothetical protein
MSKNSERARTASLFLECAELYDKELKPAVLKTYLADLGDVPVEDIARALAAHRKDPDRGRFFPRPADIFAKLSRGHDHPPVDVAWALVLKSFDETESIVWSEQMECARNVALDVWNTGDKIGARMAFRGAYERLIQAGPPRWKVSVGFDERKRIEAVEKARDMGLLSTEQATNLLPAPDQASGPVAEVAGLLTGKTSPAHSDGDLMAKLQELREALDEAEAVGRYR